MSTTPNTPVIKEAFDAYAKALQTKPRAIYDAAAKVLETDDFQQLANFINLMTATLVEAQKIEAAQTH